MHFLLPLLIWGISFSAAYSVGRGWVEANHANGFPLLGAWLLAALTSVGFTSAYFLLIVAIVEAARAGGVTPEMTAGLWDAWILWVVAPVVALGGVSFLGSSARTYREAVTSSSLFFPTYNALSQKYGSVTSTPQAARAVTRDLTRRTRRSCSARDPRTRTCTTPAPW